ncbi:hypothetical protein RMN57_17485 [Kitasatospora sp. CM 4170]|uniref:Helix-turn-helix domain-containing protein n=1 Tax=Kitasatospora aburaviensis TaxID=67265 RepID=A0ABW1ETE3_9ACTN|nr:hypothetical protein [Kitasatospora sp. CM 4170]WNM46364.1 hypothetical protein RMN57_17485 [Kitasatospora sp. CM 4170]
MQIHRSAHARGFSVLPNVLLQDRRLSFTARGLLADLLSRPDGWREDGRQIADSSPHGRGTVRRTLKELTEAGYYRVELIRMPDGTLRSEAHVYDTPQPRRSPGDTPPDVGGPEGGAPVTPPVKNPEQEPTLPAESPDPQTAAAVALLFRVIRPEPRLRLGAREAAALAPLVAEWLQRGSTEADLAQALLPGLPPAVSSPVGLLRSRLERKMPPERATPEPHRAGYAECARCHDPVPRPGICRACAGLAPRPLAVGRGAAVVAAGVARARLALRGPRPAPGVPG